VAQSERAALQPAQYTTAVPTAITGRPDPDHICTSFPELERPHVDARYT